VSGTGNEQDDELVEVELHKGRLRECDMAVVRWVERAAEDPLH
jgi:hypothetical protein